MVAGEEEQPSHPVETHHARVHLKRIKKGGVVAWVCVGEVVWWRGGVVVLWCGGGEPW